MPATHDADPIWPDLTYSSWAETLATLQLWTQIVGKIRLTLTPWLNHSWQTPLYVTARGLGTSPIPIGAEIFEIEFDFIAHRLNVRTSRGAERFLPLEAQSVADFFAATIDLLDSMGVPVAIKETPNEVPDPIRFSEDRTHAAYDAAAADLSARRARSISSGAASILRLHGSRDDPPRPIRAACPDCPMTWRAKPIRTKLAAPVSGPAPRPFRARPSIPTPILNRPAFATGGSRKAVPSMRRSGNSSCPTTRSRNHETRTPCCSTSCRRPMRPQPMPQAGTATLSNAHLAFRVGSARSKTPSTTWSAMQKGAALKNVRGAPRRPFGDEVRQPVSFARASLRSPTVRQPAPTGATK
jgi:hypothetical protein